MYSSTCFPIELLLKVFELLKSKQDLSCCQLTCKNWRSPAQKVLYRWLEIEDTKTAELIGHTIIDGPSEIGKMVKCIDFGSLFRNKINLKNSVDLLMALIKATPNVQTLRTQNPTEVLWDTLVRARQMGYWKNMKSIPFPGKSSDIKFYVTAALAFTSSLERLLLCDDFDRTTPKNENILMFNKLRAKLPDFTALKYLNIIVNGNKAIYEFDSIFQDCPQLEAMDLKIHRGSFFIPVLNSEIMQDTTLIQPALKMKSFKLASTLLNHQNTVDYIQKKLPNLDVLWINHSYDYLIPRPGQPVPQYFTEVTANAFMKYLFKIPSIKIERVKTHNILEVIAGFLEAIPPTTKVGCDIASLNHMIGMPEKGSISFERTVEKPYELAVSVDIDDVVKGSNGQVMTVPPHVAIIERFGYRFTGMTLGYMVSPNLATPIEKNRLCHQLIKGHLLDHLFEHCLKLESLTLDNWHLKELDPNMGYNKALKKIWFIVCKVDRSIFNALSLRLPNFKEFSFMDNGFCVKEYPIIVDLPHSDLDVIFWYNMIATAKELHLRVSSAAGEQYYTGNKSKLILDAKDAYDTAVGTRSELCFHVICKSLKKFHISCPGIIKECTLTS